MSGAHPAEDVGLRPATKCGYLHPVHQPLCTSRRTGGALRDCSCLPIAFRQAADRSSTPPGVEVHPGNRDGCHEPRHPRPALANAVATAVARHLKLEVVAVNAGLSACALRGAWQDAPGALALECSPCGMGAASLNQLQVIQVLLGKIFTARCIAALCRDLVNHYQRLRKRWARQSRTLCLIVSSGGGPCPLLSLRQAATGPHPATCSESCISTRLKRAADISKQTPGEDRAFPVSSPHKNSGVVCILCPGLPDTAAVDFVLRQLLRPNTISLNSGISACRSAWTSALALAAPRQMWGGCGS